MSMLAKPVRPRNSRPPFPVYRFSVDEYHLMTKAGILTEDHNVELLEGWIVPKMSRNPPHEYSLSKANRLIGHLLSSEWYIRSQMAITTADSEPEPDIAVVMAPEERYETRHPESVDIGLLVEVSDSTLSRDGGEKLVLFARAGIVCYWIINIPDRQVEVYTLPTGPDATPGFQQRQIYRPGDAIPLTIGGRLLGTIAVNELLPRV